MNNFQEHHHGFYCQEHQEPHSQENSGDASMETEKREALLDELERMMFERAR